MAWKSHTDRLLKVATRVAFKTPAEYTPAGRDMVCIAGVFDKAASIVDPNTGATISSNQPQLGIRLADLPVAPSNGDMVRIDGVDYKVYDCQGDGEGGALLLLHEK